MPTSVQLDPAVEARLEKLAQLTGRSTADCLHELIVEGLDDLEDAYLGAAVMERIRTGEEKTYSLDDVAAELGLDPTDL